MNPIKIDTSALPPDARIFIISENEFTRFTILKSDISSFKHINKPIRYYNSDTEFKEPVVIRVRKEGYMPYETTTKVSIKPILLKDELT